MNAARRLVSVTLASVLMVTCGLVVAGAPALALKTHLLSGSIGTAGSGPGQLEEPISVAVNSSSESLAQPAAGDVYVDDQEKNATGNNRIERFSATGVYLGQFNGSGTFEVEGKTETGAAAPTGRLGHTVGEIAVPPQFDPETQGITLPGAVAVDSSGSALDLSDGDVYVIDRVHDVIDKFSATGTYEGQLPGICESAGTCVGADVPFHEPFALAVDSAGNLWVAEDQSEFDERVHVSEFSDTGSFIKQLHVTEGKRPVGEEDLNVPFGAPHTGLAVDSSNNLYEITETGPVKINSDTGLSEYNFANARGAGSIGVIEKQSKIGELGGLGVAFSPSTDNVLFAESNATSGEGGTISEYDVGKEISSTPLATFGVGDFAESWTNSYQSLAIGAAGTVYVTEPATGRVLYFDEVVLPAATTEEASAVSEVGATLNGVVDPSGLSVTACEFEYGTEGSYTQTASCESSPGSGSGGVSVSARIIGLSPDTTYDFRLHVKNGEGVNTGEMSSFTTHSPLIVGGSSFSGVGSTSATLTAEINAGGRAVEYQFEYGTSESYDTLTPKVQVESGHATAPVHTQISGLTPDTAYHFRVLVSDEEAGVKEGTDVAFSTYPAAVGALPDGRVYEMVTPVENDEADVYLGSTWPSSGEEGIPTTRAFRAAADGDAVAFESAPTVGGEGQGGAGLGNAQLATRSAEGGWGQVNIEPQAIFATEFISFSDDLSNGIISSLNPLVPGGPGRGGHPGYYVRSGSGGYQALPGVYRGESEDGSHVLVEESNRLSEVVGGTVSPVGVFPNGTVANQSFPAGARNEISADGSRVVWGSEEGGSKLYLRDMTNGESVQLDAAQGGSGSGKGKFWAASSDESKIFFTDEERLTSDSTAGGQGSETADLYECEIAIVAGKLACNLRDLTVDPGASANVQGVLGVSPDGEYVYFVADGVLADGATQQECIEYAATLCNLYVRHDGQTKLIGTLSSEEHEDHGDWETNSAFRGHENTAQVSADGSLVFMSNQSLTGYDNNGSECVIFLNKFEPGACDEVYVYQPTVGSGRLFCASCDPSREPPVPGKEAGAGGGLLPSINSNSYQMRWISEDGGRVFFDSDERLVARDTNGKQDVYEWERDGTGSCTQEAGCIYLLSSGGGTSNSYLLDASANGDDVFIVSRDPLTAEGQNEDYAVYDVRVDGLRSPSPPACTGTGCQGVPAAPPTFATPSSETFDGVGNFPPPLPTALKPNKKLTKKAIKCKKGRQLRHGKCAKKSRSRKADGKRSSHGKGSK